MHVRVAVVLSGLFLLAGSLNADTAEQWIAKARAYLGSESDLSSVTCVRYSATLQTTVKMPSAEDKTKFVEQLMTVPADLVFQKPFQQRTIIRWPQVIETNGLDGYDAWQKRTSTQNPAQWQVTLLDAAQVKRERANAWENLNFFSGIEKKGGTVELDGEVLVDGVDCVKLSFIHSANIIFRRYFEKNTGRLVKTETDSGSEIREEGELIVHGLRFPQKIINKSATGQTVTIAFDKITLNEKFSETEFAVPTLQSN